MSTGEIDAESSPERFDPAEDAGTLMHSEHVARYRWACQMTRGVDVLDAGCGTGYGTAILAGSGPARLVGFDVAPDAVEQARSATAGRAEIEVADIRSLPLPDDAVDVVVCFEVIEHIERRDEALREFARVIRPGGALLISSPNRNQYPPGNEHHVHEYTPDELAHSLGRNFRNVELHRQHAWLGTLIADVGALTEAGADGGIEALMHTATPDAAAREETYSVAIAGDGDLPRAAPRLVLGHPFEVKWWNEQLIKEQHEAVAQRRELERRAARLSDQGRQLVDVEQAHASLISAHAEASADVARLSEELQRERALRVRADSVVLGMNRSISWRLTAPLRRVKRLVRR